MDWLWYKGNQESRSLVQIEPTPQFNGDQTMIHWNLSEKRIAQVLN